MRIIDKQPIQNVGQRGAGLTVCAISWRFLRPPSKTLSHFQPRTLDAFHFLGVLSDIKKAGGPMLPMQVRLSMSLECARRPPGVK